MTRADGACACCSRRTVKGICPDCLSTRFSPFTQRILELRNQIDELKTQIQPLVDQIVRHSPFNNNNMHSPSPSTPIPTLQHHRHSQLQQLSHLQSQASKSRESLQQVQFKYNVLSSSATYATNINTKSHKSIINASKQSLLSALHHLASYLNKEWKELENECSQLSLTLERLVVLKTKLQYT